MCQLPARPAAAKINSAVPTPMWAVVQALQQRGRNVGHIRVLVDLAVHADPEARRLIREAGRHIGEVLAGAVNLLNPDALVITGDMAKAYDIFVAGLRETVYGNATAVATRERRGDPRTTDPALHPRRPIRRDRQRGDDSRPRSVCRSYGRFDLTDSYRIRHDGSDVVVFVALDPERSQGVHLRGWMPSETEPARQHNAVDAHARVVDQIAVDDDHLVRPIAIGWMANRFLPPSAASFRDSALAWRRTRRARHDTGQPVQRARGSNVRRKQR